MRIMEIENNEKAKLEYSKFCAENELPDCFGTICYFMDTQKIHIGFLIDLHSKRFAVDYVCLDSLRIHKKGRFKERTDAELFIAQESFNYLERKGIKEW